MDQTVGSAPRIDHRANNFDALRLVGALVVMFAHAFALRGEPERIPVLLGHPMQTVGVIIFFAISGYLITASFQRNHNPVTYLLARCLRIFPALIVVVLLTAYVMGPLVTTWSREDYLAHPMTWDYVVNNIKLFVQFQLPGVFETNVYPGAVNGSLWTLFVEFVCYLAAPLLFLVPGRLRPVGALVAVVLCGWLALQPTEESPVYWAVRMRDAAALWVFFAGGAFIRLALTTWSWFKLRGDIAVALLAFELVFSGVWPDWGVYTAALTVPYCVLVIGLASTPYVHRAARFGDFSYGLYLYAFPVQQLVIHWWGVKGVLSNLLIVLALTLVCAVASWYLIERPALALKERILRFSLPARSRPEQPAVG